MDNDKNNIYIYDNEKVGQKNKEPIWRKKYHRTKLKSTIKLNDQITNFAWSSFAKNRGGETIKQM